MTYALPSTTVADPFLHNSLPMTDPLVCPTHPSCTEIMPGVERKIIPASSVARSAHPSISPVI